MATIGTKMQDVLNRHINAEMYSSYLYLAMSAYFESLNLTGFANWMRVQSQEEALHFNKFYDYVHERGGRVTMEAIEKPPADWSSPVDAFRATYEHEQMVTEMIDKLVGVAIEERDRAPESFLKWFVDEQVEEEATADRIVKTLEMSGESPVAVLMLDREMAARVFTPPPGEGAPAAP